MEVAIESLQFSIENYQVSSLNQQMEEAFEHNHQHLQTLLEFGFGEGQSIAALKKTGNSVQEAINLLVNNQDLGENILEILVS